LDATKPPFLLLEDTPPWIEIGPLSPRFWRRRSTPPRIFSPAPLLTDLKFSWTRWNILSKTTARAGFHASAFSVITAFPFSVGEDNTLPAPLKNRRGKSSSELDNAPLSPSRPLSAAGSRRMASREDCDSKTTSSLLPISMQDKISFFPFGNFPRARIGRFLRNACFSGGEYFLCVERGSPCPTVNSKRHSFFSTRYPGSPLFSREAFFEATQEKEPFYALPLPPSVGKNKMIPWSDFVTLTSPVCFFFQGGSTRLVGRPFSKIFFFRSCRNFFYW